jgi:hypothetical protein
MVCVMVCDGGRAGGRAAGGRRARVRHRAVVEAHKRLAVRRGARRRLGTCTAHHAMPCHVVLCGVVWCVMVCVRAAVRRAGGCGRRAAGGDRSAKNGAHEVGKAERVQLTLCRGRLRSCQRPLSSETQPRGRGEAGDRRVRRRAAGEAGGGRRSIRKKWRARGLKGRESPAHALSWSSSKLPTAPEVRDATAWAR